MSILIQWAHLYSHQSLLNDDGVKKNIPADARITHVKSIQEVFHPLSLSWLKLPLPIAEIMLSNWIFKFISLKPLFRALKVICIELITQTHRSTLYLQSEQTGTRWTRWLSDLSPYMRCSILRKQLTFFFFFPFFFSSHYVLGCKTISCISFQITIKTDKEKRD